MWLVDGCAAEEGYDADDKELQSWTAALYMALVVVHGALLGVLSTSWKEVLYRESAIHETSLRMPGEIWARDVGGF
jgi:uncharacterized protein (DUF2236 family)